MTATVQQQQARVLADAKAFADMAKMLEALLEQAKQQDPPAPFAIRYHLEQAATALRVVAGNLL